MFVRLQSSWTFIKEEDGIEILSTLKNKRYKLNGDSEKLEKLFIRLEAGIDVNNVSTIANQLDLEYDLILSILDLLRKNEITVTRDTKLFSEYQYLYDRQIRFFDSFENQEYDGEFYNSKLQNSRVLIIGLGGYGAWLALFCSRMGIKNIIGVDFDKVEHTNLNRQVIYNLEDVGKLKIEVAKIELESVDPTINFEGINMKIENSDDLLPLLKKVDFVFNAFGYFPDKLFELIWKECLKNNIPSLTFGGSWIGPLNVPGKTPCINCLTLEKGISEMIEASQVRFYNPQNSLPSPSLAPRMAFTTSVAVWEAVRFLTGIDEPKTQNGVLMFDLFNYENPPFRQIAQKEDCNYCQKVKSTNNSNTIEIN